MRIVCPSCQAVYEVPEKLLTGAPRKVRCARCGNHWIPEPAASPAVEAPPIVESQAELHAAAPPALAEQQPAPGPGPGPTLPQAPPARAAPPPVVPRAVEKLAPEPSDIQAGHRTARLAGLAWAASMALLAGAGWAAVVLRADIMAVWAPSRRLYVLLGLG